MNIETVGYKRLSVKLGGSFDQLRVHGGYGYTLSLTGQIGKVNKLS